jgi:hypothetical protein
MRMRDASELRFVSFTLFAAISFASGALSVEWGPLLWKRPDPGTPAYLGDDGGGAKTVTVCDTSDHYRQWLGYEGSEGCQDFQQDLRAVIEVVILNRAADLMPGTDWWMPIVKVHIPSRKFTGYLRLFGVHPIIPSGTVVHFKSTLGTKNLYPTADAGLEDGLELGKALSH